MMRRIKVIYPVTILLALMVITTLPIKAGGTSATYSGYVTKLNDYKSAGVEKTTSDSNAKDKVTSMNSGTYTGWVENDAGSNCTQKTSFSQTGTYSMKYYYIYDNDECYLTKGQTGHLVLSTVLTNFTSSSIAGQWSPDNYGF